MKARVKGPVFRPYEMPVAASMIRLARSATSMDHWHPFQEYMCYWTAFNNVYTTVTYNLGHKAELKRKPDGSIGTRMEDGLRKVIIRKPPDEKSQIRYAINEFNDHIRHSLITLENTKFFVYREPKWQDSAIQHDILGQRLNGVINVNYTTNRDYPVWANIDTQKYEQYIAGNNTSKTLQITLTEQVVLVLYTVRNNLYHGGKRSDDADDVEVVEKALPLLQMIVDYFIRP